MENVVELQSQQELAQKIVRKLSGMESIVLLSGAKGSGRSTICHVVAEKADDKMQVIFLPCDSSLSKENLRELLLQQMFPEKKLSCDCPLTESISNVDTANLNALIIADDIDDVPLEFLREINTLAAELSGKLSFLGVCETESAKAAGGIFNVEPLEVPPLDSKECIFLCREYLSSQNKMAVFEGKWEQLPSVFKSKPYTPAAVFSTVDAFDKESKEKSEQEHLGTDKSADNKEGSAKKSSKWPYLLLLLALIGGAVYYFGDKETEEIKTEPAVVVPEEEKIPEAVVDDGALNEKIAEGIEVEGKDTKLQNELVISGDVLEQIEESTGGTAAVNPLQNAAAKTKDADSAASLEDKKVQTAPALDAGKKDEAKADQTEGKDVFVLKIKDKDDTAQPFSSAASQGNTAVSTSDSAAAAKSQDAVKQVEQEGNADPDAFKKKIDEGEPKIAGADSDTAKVRQESSLTAQKEPETVLSVASDHTFKSTTVIDDKTLDEIDNALTKAGEAQKNSAYEVNEDVKQNPAPVKAMAAPADKTEKSSQVTAGEKVKPEVSSKEPVRAANKSTQVKKRVQRGDKILRFDRIPFTGEAIPGGVAEIAFKDDSHYTVQVVSAYSRVRAVEVSAGVRGRYWIYETQRNNRPWYVLINGDYATAAEARAAIKRLPQALKLSGPFIKKFSQVKFEMDKKQ